MATDVGIKLKIEGEKEYKQSLSSIIASQKEWESEIKAVGSALESEASQEDKNRKMGELLEKQIESQEKKLGLMKDQLEKVEDAYGADSKEAKTLRTNINKATTALNKMKSEAKSLSARMDSVGKSMQNAGKKMQKVGDKMSKYVSAPLAGVGAASVKMAMDAETSFAKVNTIIDRTIVSYDDLKKGVISASNETGVAVTDFNEALYSSISAGVDSGNAISFTTDMVKLAKGGFTDTSKAVDVVTTVLNAYGLSAEEATAVSDKLITTQNLGKTTVDELAGSLGKIIPTAKAANVNFDQVSASMAILTQRGISTNESATYLNAMLGELSKSGSDVDEVLREKTGKSFAELQAAGVPLNEVLQILNEAAIEDGVALGDLFSQQTASKAALTIMADDGQGYISVLDQMAVSAGATQTAMETMADTTEEKLNKTFNTLKNTGILLGDTLLEMASPGIETAAKKVEDLSNWFNNLDENGQKAVGNVVTALMIGGPAVKVAGGLVGAVGKVVEKIGGAGGLIATLGNASGAAGGLGTAASALAGAGAPIAALAGTVAWAAFVVKSMTGPVKASNQDVIDLIEAQKTNVEALESAMDNVNLALASGNQAIQEVNDQSAMALSLVDELEQLEGQSNRTAEEESRMQMIVAELNHMYPDLKVQIDKSTGSISKSAKEIRKYVKNAKDMALIEAYSRASSEAMDALVKANNDLYIAQRDNSALKERRKQIDLTIKALTGLQSAEDAEDHYKYSGQIESLTNDLNALDVEIAEADEKITGYQIAASDAAKTVEGWNDQIQEVSDNLSDQSADLGENTEEMDKNTDAAKKNQLTLQERAQKIAEESQSAIQKIREEQNEWADLYIATKDSIDNQIKKFEEWQDSSDLTFGKMLHNLKTQTRGLKNYTSNLETLSKAAVKSGDENFKQMVQYIAGMGVEGAAYAQALVDEMEKDGNDFNRILRQWGFESGAETNLAKILTYIQNDFQTGAQAAAVAFNEAIDEMGDDSLLGKARENVQSTFHSITSSFFGGAEDIGTAKDTIVTEMSETAEALDVSSKVEQASYDNHKAAQAAAAAIGHGASSKVHEVETAIDSLTGEVDDISGDIDSAAKDIKTSSNNSVLGMIGGMLINQLLLKATAAGVAGTVTGIGKSIDDKKESLKKSGSGSVSSVADGMDASQKKDLEPAEKRVETSVKTTVVTIEQMQNDFRASGQMVVKGLVAGMDQEAETAYRKATAIANFIRSHINDALKIKSPSRVTMETGKYVAEGLALGMEKQMPTVKKASTMLGHAAVPFGATGADVVQIRAEAFGGLDVDSIYAAVRSGAMDGQQPVVISEKSFKRALVGMGVQVA